VIYFWKRSHTYWTLVGLIGIVLGLIPLGIVVLCVDNAKEERALHAWTYSSASDFVRKEPNNPNSHGALAAVYVDQKKYNHAIEEFQLAVDLAPNDASRHYEMGVALRIAGHEKEARVEFQQAIKLNVLGEWPSEKAAEMLRSK